MRLFFPILMTFTASVISFNDQIHAAHCARCTKIEVERAEEQAKHPQTAGYYDDTIQLHTTADKEPNNPSIIEEKKSSPTSEISEKNTSTSSDKSFSTLLAQASPISQNRLEKQRVSESNSRDYSSLLTILQTKDFLDVLTGPFTLFVPTNEALTKLSPHTLQDLSRAENRNLLATLVASHIVAKKLLEEEMAQEPIKTLSGRNLTIRAEQGQLMVNEAHILRVIPVSNNGIIYVIDRVLFP